MGSGKNTIRADTASRNVAFAAFWIIMAMFLFVAKQHDFLLFHFLIELITICIAISIFVVSNNTRPLLRNNLILLMGISLIAIAGLDALHTLSYTGMGLFPSFGTNLPTQLWIAARYMQAGTILVGFMVLNKKGVSLGSLRQYRVAALAYIAMFSLIILSIFIFKNFPQCYIEGEGLTRFKIYSEYAISLLLFAGLVMLYRYRQQFEPIVAKSLAAFLIFSILSELAFTTYINVYGASNMIGHYLKLAAFIGLYMAILFPGANNPISLLMRDLEESRARAVREQTLAKQYLDIAGVMIIAYRPDGTIMLANNKAGAILGVDKHELVGKNWFMEFIPSSLQDELRYVFYELTEGNPAKVQYRENPVMSKDGTVRHIAWYNEVLRDDDGGIVGIISSGEDITARKRAEEEIYYHLRLEEVVSTLSRTLMRPVEEIDLDAALKSIGEVTNVDRAYIFLYDYQTGTMSNTHEWAAAGVEPEKDNLQGLRFEDFTWWNDKLDEQSYINEHDVSAIEDLNVRGVLEAQRIRSLLVIELMQDDGPRIGFMGFDSLRHKVWRPEDIRLIRMLAETISLYFKRARDQDLLLASERRFRGLVQKSSEITMLVDREGIIAYCSPSIAEILGYAAEEVLGTPYSDLCCGEVELPVARGLEEQGSFVTYETQMKKKDGRSADFEIRASNLLEDKDIGGIVINARDITKRRQAQRERERAIAELKERNRELEEFTRQLYHDLQTPLVTIGSYSDEVIKKLGDGQDPSSARLDAYVIRNAARQLSAFATELAIKIRIRK